MYCFVLFSEVPVLFNFKNDISVSPGSDDCGRNVKALYPFSDKCFQKFISESPATICSKTGLVKNENVRYDRYTYADCGCDEKSQGNGFYCYRPCSRSDERLMACKNDLTCQVASNGSNFCGCTEGSIVSNAIYCTLIDDSCDSCRHNCHAASRCISTNDASRFKCAPCSSDLGYIGDGYICKDIDECATGVHSCDKNANCINLVPLDDNFLRYRCECREGYRNDSTTGTTCSPCQDENECEKNPGICGDHAICQNTPGSYSCICKPGFTFKMNICIDIDECSSAQNDCHTKAECTNTIGSYTCSCKAGYKGDGVHSCDPDPAYCEKCDKNTTTCVLNTVKDEYECQCRQYHHRVSDIKCTPNSYCDNPEKVNCAPKPKAICVDYPDGSGFSCTCAEGYIGNGTYCVEKNICDRERPCQLVARTICVPDPIDENLYTCECKPGYVRQIEGLGNNSAPCFESGGYMANNCTICDKRTEECQDVRHEQIELGSLKACYCKSGYRRTVDGKCRNIDECMEGSHDCDPIRARCEDKDPHTHGMTHQCTCLVGYEGSGKKDSCKNINECLNITHPVCIRTGRTKCADTIGSYICYCDDGYHLNTANDVCEDIDECSSYLHECKQYSACINDVGSYHCVCNNGFRQISVNSLGHPVCEPIDQCKEGHWVTQEPVCDYFSEDCLNLLGDYECLCKKGFERLNGRRCIDIDECRSPYENNCDLTTTRCNNLNGTYECICQDGFEKPPNNEKATFCDDVDECARGTHHCHPNSLCRDRVGSYICQCEDGFHPLPGSNAARPYCERDKICEKQRRLCSSGYCIDTIEAPYYRCECSVATVKYNQTTCIDPKYCDNQEFKCPSYAHCSGIGKCECEQGYRWIDLKTPLTIQIIKTRRCKEIDWCSEVGAAQCKHTKCRSTAHIGPGTGECYCDSGFNMIDGHCEDINECLNPNICPEHSTCENKLGSYQCNCDRGYAIDASNSLSNIKNPICKDINECHLEMHNCTYYLNTHCVNTIGSYTCECLPGYVYDMNRPNNALAACIDENECLRENPPCNTTTAICKNYLGSYECICKNGYRGRGTIELPCIDINECDEGSHNCSSLTYSVCENIPGSWLCNCTSGFRLVAGKCQNINECAENKHNCQPFEICRDLTPGFRCDCPIGYYRRNNTCDDINECAQRDACPNGPGDICNNTIGSYQCNCISGYKKPSACSAKPLACQCTNINECEEGRPDGSPYCGKNTVCKDTEGSAICTCLPKHEGLPYQPEGCQPSSACNENSCSENSHCVEDDTLSNGYRCVCNDGFFHSEIFNKCVENPCTSVKCIGGGPCSYYESFDLNKIVHVCECPDDKIYDESTDTCISQDICNCQTNPYPCINSTVCSDPDRMLCSRSGARALCTCLKQFVYNELTKRCDEIDYCSTMNCDPRATCRNIKENGYNTHAICVCPSNEKHVDGKCVVDTDCSLLNYCRTDPNTYCSNGTCICRPGFYKAKETDLCKMEEPCDELRRIKGSAPCGPNAIEQNIQDPRACECNCRPGYTKLDNDCIDVNECDGANPCIRNETHPECVNTPGSYRCECGFDDPRFEIFQGKCQIPDPCIKNQVVCGPNAQCSSQTGKCVCIEGFSFDTNNENCENINECLTPHLYSCPENSECIDKTPGYECKCQKGYKQVNSTDSKLGYICIDIDECDPAEANYVQCPGSPNQCTLNPDFKICPIGSICVNLPGNYRCDCKPPLIQHGLKDCAENTTSGCVDDCGLNAHCIKLINERNVYNCTCNVGFERVNSSNDCTNINECDNPNICQENAICVDTMGSYRCECQEPYVNQFDECVMENKCNPNPCPVGSTCKQLEEMLEGRWVTCRCDSSGFRFNQTSFTCIDIDECAECTQNTVCPCPDDAIQCINTQGSFRCQCAAGYEYDPHTNTCIDINECELGLHLTTCSVSAGTCKNINGSWECICNAGYTNKSPQECILVDFCANEKNVCDEVTTICKIIYQMPFYTCECKDGYQKDPYNSSRCVDKNECSMGVHNCNSLTQDCINSVPGYSCNCSTGYELVNNECVSSIKCELQCPEFSQCITHRNGSQSCVCLNNYEWVENEKACSIKGCDSTNCPAHSTCVELQAANNTIVNQGNLRYQCVCDAHYVLDKTTQLCLPPVDPCKNVNCGNGQCIRQDDVPFYGCSCPTVNCQNMTCTEDSCDKNADCLVVANSTAIQCRCKTGFKGLGVPDTCVKDNACERYAITCSNMATCIDLPEPGLFKCQCNAGYTGNGTYCYDIDECSTGSHNCNENSNCVNTQGSYVCDCKPGFKQIGISGACADIDECATATHNCEVTTTYCTNTIGSFYCSCKEGFENITYPFNNCIDINECNLNQTICGIHICVNTVPGYKCECREGYQPRGESNICEDIDECTTGSNICHRYADCYNTPGSYDCSCKDGYEGDGVDNCSIIDDCITGKHKCDNLTTVCEMTPDRPAYKCVCLPGYEYPVGQSDPHKCEDIQECLDVSLYNPATTICEELPGSYRLKCKSGYENTHPYPSDHNCTCTNLNECTMDPSYFETKNRLSNGKLPETREEGLALMIPPRVNNSGYAYCYYQFLAGSYYSGGMFLPICIDLEPEQTFELTSVYSDDFPPPVGFGCECFSGHYAYDTETDSVVCNSDNCACSEDYGLICENNKCVCIIDEYHMRIENGIVACVENECDENYLYPSTLAHLKHLILCQDHVFHAVSGFKLIRDNETRVLLNVEDIDECTESIENPCCLATNCTSNDCVSCMNSYGSYICQIGNSKLVCGNVNKDTCICLGPTCTFETSWFYSCGGYSGHLIPQIAEPQYNKVLCSRIKNADSPGFMTFQSVEELYRFVDTIPEANRFAIPCMFPPSSEDFSNIHLFNYWGPCTDKIEEVKCEVGNPVYNRNKDQVRCPIKAPLLPKIPAIGQPIGHPYPRELGCYSQEELFKNGAHYWTSTGKLSFAL